MLKAIVDTMCLFLTRDILKFTDQNNLCGGRIDLMAWEADKKAVLDGLVDDVSTHILVVSILISELNIIDDSQKN